MASMKGKRKHIRLADYDYSQSGIYFVTICSQIRECIFGEITNGNMKLNLIGNIAYRCWEGIEKHYTSVNLFDFVVMPNHVHGMVGLNSTQFKNPVLGDIVGKYKAAVTREINKRRGEIYRAPTKVWQRNYYEHIIRNETAFERITEYIRSNPSNWKQDKENRDRNKLNNFYGWVDTYWKN
ncbi:MAG: hypothetical protein HOD97_05730 [Candidatus Marinimicrobia bacterium]|jgi:REP element-mobilizing transposase RayT|nr:hypothetical protein [Candidatus Neomarinimicrobiota bacterium]MBT3829451.1 hypothetical protein [Candidatus Neomarinimicrobiota bacterium]MBT3996967.1 hypothetical protein [Candidatus Neomarinimicrobiota bacterium]MBT4281093.1 hypothetical protein [Candidatus Neomarinimicrobiota bacterium]MBT4569321.1 hypothetical protein [Candidatus Neomarinimicrobiota bacterium]